MKQLPWSTYPLSSAGGPEVVVLVPETGNDGREIQEALESARIRDRGWFDRDGIVGRLTVPSDLRWEPDGAVQLGVVTQDKTIPVWFWLIEFHDGTAIRQTIWWGAHRDSRKAQSLN